MRDIMNGLIFDIEHGSFVDGPGIRTAVFFKGCNLRCAWCHNPESQSAKPQMMFYRDKCIGCGRCKEVCPHDLAACELCGKCALYCPQGARKISGREATADEVMAEIMQDEPFYGNDGGVTFSGGECMLQADFLLELLKKCKARGIHTAVDTAGYVPFSVFEKILPWCDMILYDLKSMDADIHREYVGADNALILDNLKKLLASGKRVWVRIPLIPGVNDSEDNIRRVAAFYRQYGTPEKTELLPYHAMGENKYRALGLTPRPFPVPEKADVERLKEILYEG